MLTVDIGNSRISMGLVRGDRVRGIQHLPARRHTGSLILGRLRQVLGTSSSRAAAAGAVLSCVVPSLAASWRAAMERATGGPVLVVGPDTVRNMPIRYRDPHEVGPDRLANAVAARALHGTPAIVVDFGTATNFDCVSASGAFLGGVIAPGVTTAAEGLYDHAARLARVTLWRQAHTLGRSTDEAVRAGILHGAAELTDGLVRRLAKEVKGRPHVIATGGFAAMMFKECATLDCVDEGLTMKGMARMWEERK